MKIGVSRGAVEVNEDGAWVVLECRRCDRVQWPGGKWGLDSWLGVGASFQGSWSGRGPCGV